MGEFNVSEDRGHVSEPKSEHKGFDDCGEANDADDDFEGGCGDDEKGYELGSHLWACV